MISRVESLPPLGVRKKAVRIDGAELLGLFEIRFLFFVAVLFFDSDGSFSSALHFLFLCAAETIFLSRLPGFSFIGNQYLNLAWKYDRRRYAILIVC